MVEKAHAPALSQSAVLADPAVLEVVGEPKQLLRVERIRSPDLRMRVAEPTHEALDARSADCDALADHEQPDVLVGLVHDGVANPGTRREHHDVVRTEQMQLAIDPGVGPPREHVHAFFLHRLGMRQAAAVSGREDFVMDPQPHQAEWARERGALREYFVGVGPHDLALVCLMKGGLTGGTVIEVDFVASRASGSFTPWTPSQSHWFRAHCQVALKTPTEPGAWLLPGPLPDEVDDLLGALDAVE